MVASSEVDAHDLREQLFRSVYEFFVGCQGAKPLLIVLDDLQWADEATVLLLRDLAERLGGSRIVIAATYWESELDSGRPFTNIVSRLLRRRRAQRVGLTRLTDREVEKMVAALAETPLTPVQVVGIQAATEGNPLFVEQSYLYMSASESMLGGSSRVQASFTEEDLELAQSVRGLIGRRLERLSEPAQRMLVAAGVIGRDFDIALLEAFGELSGHELREALDEATRARFLTAAGTDRYRFAHDLVRKRVLAVLPLPRLQAYHLAVADTLERVYGKSAPERASEIGHHLYQAGTSADPVRTATFLSLAARNALATASGALPGSLISPVNLVTVFISAAASIDWCVRLSRSARPTAPHRATTGSCSVLAVSSPVAAKRCTLMTLSYFVRRMRRSSAQRLRSLCSFLSQTSTS